MKKIISLAIISMMLSLSLCDAQNIDCNKVHTHKPSQPFYAKFSKNGDLVWLKFGDAIVDGITHTLWDKGELYYYLWTNASVTMSSQYLKVDSGFQGFYCKVDTQTGNFTQIIKARDWKGKPFSHGGYIKTNYYSAGGLNLLHEIKNFGGINIPYKNCQDILIHKSVLDKLHWVWLINGDSFDIILTIVEDENGYIYASGLSTFGFQWPNQPYYRNTQIVDTFPRPKIPKYTPPVYSSNIHQLPGMHAEAGQDSIFTEIINHYPNPGITDGVLEIQSNYAGNTVIQLYDLQGKQIWHKPMSANIYKGRNQYPIPISELAQGVYILVFNFHEKQYKIKIEKL